MEERAARLIDWLTSDQCHDLDRHAVLPALASLLCAEGVPIDLIALYLRRLHPRILGSVVLWTPGEQVQVRDLQRGPEFPRSAIRSPIAHVMQTRTSLLLPADDTHWSFPDELLNHGLSEAFLAPMPHGTPGARVSVMTFGTRRPRGFSEAERELFHSIMPSLRNAVELKIWRLTATTLLNTYVGEDTGRRILAGHIARGDVATLEAALMFCDLRGFTELSNRVSDQRILELLNIYFDKVIPAIAAHGGEVLKLIGDGVLAVFQNAGGPSESCLAALDAAHTAQERLRLTALPDAELRAGIALHYGRVSYGNIGSRDRLDFTVIGPDVNLTSRIEAMCGTLGQSLLMSERFAKVVSRSDVTGVGSHYLRGFAEPVELFAIKP
jgi:adenylate cyclase